MSGGFKRANASGGAPTPARWRLWTALTVVGLVVIYTWTIAECGPWDPWETHYGEVARNILGRDDPMDLWWRPGYGPDGKREQSFASKHALPFWCMAVAMWMFGIGDDPSSPGEMVQPYLPELSLRLPGLIGAAVMVGLLAWVVRRRVGPRAALITVVVLATLPQLAITSRQAITDIYFVAPIGGAIAAWAMATLQPDRALRTRRFFGRVELPWDRASAVFVVVLGLAAVLPLAVLHLHVTDPATIQRVSKWSKIPEIPNVGDLQQVARHLSVYWVALVLIVVRVGRWRRRSQAWMGLLYVCGGLAFMGKGILGPGLIGLVIAVHLAITGRWSLLRRVELPIGIIIFALTCFPWHHSMALFREERWVQELLIDNNLTRFASGEQEQAVGSFAFYLRTLGVAALPWVAIVPVVLVVAGRSFGMRDAEGVIPPRVELLQLATIWFVVSFGVITYSVTKYHHYLVPCLPALGIMIGLWLDGLLEPDDAPGVVRLSLSGRFVAFALAAAVLTTVLRAVIAEPASIAHLTTYLYTGMWRKGAPPTDLLATCSIPFAIGVLAWVIRRRKDAVIAMLLSGVLCTAWVLGSYLPRASDHWSQRDAFRTVYANRGPDDPVMSWWFYYRGESFFTKHRIWVSTEPNREKTREYMEKHAGKGRTAWIMTTADHAKRAGSYFPGTMRDSMETVWVNEHYALLRAPIP